MARKHHEWKIRDKVLRLGDRTLIVGILNLTPDSFSDGGKFDDPDRAFARAIELEEQGADILDIGAESTKPGVARISEAEELRRLVPVLKRLKNKLGIPISVDTYKAGVAEKALELGADIINDPSGLTFDPELAGAVNKANAGLILNHMRGTPETWAKLPPLQNPMATILTELDAAAHRALRTGLERRRIVIDPGLGFGKRKEQNAVILSRLEELARLEYPILVGPSRKHFLSKESPDETEFATAAAVTAAILHGAHLVRIHDVKSMKAVIDVADEILRASGYGREMPENAGVFRTDRAPAKPLDRAYAKPLDRTNELQETAVSNTAPKAEATPVEVPEAVTEKPEAPPVSAAEIAPQKEIEGQPEVTKSQDRKQPKPYDRTQAKPYDRTQAKPYDRTQAKPYDRTQAKPYDRTQAKPYDRTQAKPYDRTQAKPYDRTQAKPYDRTQAKPYDRTQAKPYDRTQAKPYDRTQAKPYDRTQAKPYDRTQAKPYDRTKSKSGDGPRGGPPRKTGGRPAFKSQGRPQGTGRPKRPSGR